jgi:hypothetical protein
MIAEERGLLKSAAMVALGERVGVDDGKHRLNVGTLERLTPRIPRIVGTFER